MEDIRAKCIDIFCNVMEVPAGVINEDTNPENLEEWDSLAHVQLIAALEETFGIEIDPEEGIDLENFKMILNFIRNRYPERPN